MPSIQVIGGPIHTLLPEGRTVVGRDGVCDIVLPRRSVSRRHACFICRDGDVFVEDLDSNNGTYVNGTRITETTRLADNDRINLYDVPLRFFAADVATRSNHETLEDVDEFRRTNDAERRLELVLELGRRLGSTLQIAEILPRVLDVLFRVFPQTDNGEILLVDDRGRLVPQAMKHGRGDDSSIVTITPETPELALRVFTTGDPERVVEAGDDESVLDAAEGAVSICTPITGPSDGPAGVILLASASANDGFDDSDLDLLTVIGLQAGQAIENARTHERLLATEQQRMQMATAHDVQSSILPRRRPDFEGYEFYDHYTPADAVGGDYFDYIRLTPTHVVVTIGDVCGKSLPAALHMAQLARDVRHALNSAPSLKTAMRLLNAATIEREGGLITFATCLLDTENHTASFTSAAHPLPLRRRNGEVAPVFDLDRGGLPLGIEPDVDWHVATIDIEPGDEFLFITDGVTDQFNDQRQWFGQECVTAAVRAAPAGVANIVEQVLAEVEAFRGSWPRSDDRCLVAFSRLA